MICSNCGKDSAYIYTTLHGEGCSYCLGVSQSGRSTRNIITRNSDRVGADRMQHEGDTIPPFTLDKNTKRLVPNEDFARLYPNQAANYYDDKQLKDLGLSGIKAKVAKEQQATQAEKARLEKEQVKFKGNTRKGVKDTIKAVKPKQ